MTLKELVKKFAKHAKQARKHNQKLIAQFQENYPGEPLPPHFKDEFSICEALGFMCSEILKLKERQ